MTAIYVFTAYFFIYFWKPTIGDIGVVSFIFLVRLSVVCGNLGCVMVCLLYVALYCVGVGCISFHWCCVGPNLSHFPLGMLPSSLAEVDLHVVYSMPKSYPFRNCWDVS